MESNAQYAEKSYWDERFEKEAHYEWLAGFEAYKTVVLKHLKPSDRILHIGCGSSDLSMQLYALGFTNITNVDYSEVLIVARREQHPEMQWVCDDIRSMDKIASSSFDVVIEKATLEALLVKEKSAWTPSKSALDMLDSVFAAVLRVLVPGGLFVSVSFTQPHFRVPSLLRNPEWNVHLEHFGDHFHFYVYTCKKGDRPSDETVKRYSEIAADWLRDASGEDQ